MTGIKWPDFKDGLITESCQVVTSADLAKKLIGCFFRGNHLEEFYYTMPVESIV